VIGQFDRANRDEPTDLRMIYLRNDKGELVQLDNVVKLEEQSSPPQLYHYNRFKAATLSAGLAPGSTIGDGVEAMNRIAEKVLDESFSTELTGASQ
jgi:multidrug efflux pump